MLEIYDGEQAEILNKGPEGVFGKAGKETVGALKVRLPLLEGRIENSPTLQGAMKANKDIIEFCPWDMEQGR